MHNHIIQGAKGIDADAPMRVDATTQVASTAATSDAISGNIQGTYSSIFTLPLPRLCLFGMYGIYCTQPSGHFTP